MSNKTSKMTKTAPRPIYMTSSFRGCENAKYERETLRRQRNGCARSVQDGAALNHSVVALHASEDGREQGG